MATPALVELRATRAAIRALLISDVRLCREGLESALGRHESIVVVATASTIDDGIHGLTLHDPAVVIVDIGMRDSLAGVRALAAASPHVKVVAFAVDERACDIVAYAEAGIAGYIASEGSTADLIATIEAAVREEALCSPRVAGALFKRVATLAGRTRSPEATDALSRREREILMLVRSGLSNKEIAQRLTIEVATVKNHVHNMLTKLHVTTRAEAAHVGHAPMATGPV